MTQAAAAQLEYAHPARQKRRRWKLWASIVLLAAATAFVAIRYVPDAIRRVRLARYERQCMAYTMPPTQVVYESDPAAAAKLRAGNAEYASLDGIDAYFTPTAWAKFNNARRVSIPSHGTILLHGRTSQDGPQVVVHGGVTIQPESVTFSFSLATPSAKPGGFMSRTRGDGLWIMPKPTDTFRVFAGQPDPNDPTHFTFVYELNGKKHTVDGWVEDAVTVKLERTDSPERLKRDWKEALKQSEPPG